MLVLGGGNAGISLSARLRRSGFEDVTVVDSRAHHRYRPLLNYVGAGLAGVDSARRPMTTVIPHGVDLVAEDVTAVDPGARTVITTAGRRIQYDTLVIATGLHPRLDAVPGLSDAYDDGWAASTFIDETATRVWDAVRDLQSGAVVFSVPPEPAPCAATALKPFFMACDLWRRNGVLGRLDVHLVLPEHDMLPTATQSANDHLDCRVRDLGVRVHRSSHVSAVAHESRTVAFTGIGGPTSLHDVAFAHVVPPYAAPAWLPAAGLGGGLAGQVDVDPETMQHPTHPDVWALGDVADLGMPPSGGALRHQVDVLAHNLAAGGDEELRRYDGYTVMPITVDRRRLLLAEVDRDGRPVPTLPIVDPTKPRRSTWLFDRYGLPQVYFRRILRGLV